MHMKLSSYQHLVKEWHPTKNGKLTPEDFTHGTKKKAWWLCPNGHSYYATIGNRTKNNTGCPYCSGNKVGDNNNLVAKFPEIAKEWHPTKNKELTADKVFPTSGKKVWWLCSNSHSYEKSIKHRTTMNIGCPYCSGNKVSKDNNLLYKFPDIAKDWHPVKNKDLTPDKVVFNSSKNVWWLCPKGHSYQSTPGKRTVAKPYTYSCPYCSGRKLSKDNSLSEAYPDIAKEWHPTLNGDLTPDMFTKGSQKKAWWLCNKGHYYQTSIGSRTGGKTGCPYCSNQSSEPEIRILSEFRWIFDKVINRNKIDGVEVDVFLPKYNIAIEYDGNYWHKDKENADLAKNEFLSSKEIHLVRVRQKPLKQLTGSDITVGENIIKGDLDKVLASIYTLLDKDDKDKIDEYVSNPLFTNNKAFREYRSHFPSPLPEHSLPKLYPLISNEWDYEKNFPLRPESYTKGSKAKVWWLCPKGHSYKSAIGERTRNDKPTGCPYCDGKKASKENSLQVVFPEIAIEWHPTKNNKLTPLDVTRASDKKVWWLCPKGHSYEAVVKNRTNNKSRCPYCAGKRSLANDLFD